MPAGLEVKRSEGTYTYTYTQVRVGSVASWSCSEVKKSEDTHTYIYIQTCKGHLYGQLGHEVKRSEVTYTYIQTRKGHFYGQLESLVLKSVCLFVGCLTSQEHASVSQRRICSDHFTCCHTEIQVSNQTFYLTQSQYTDTGPTSTRADPITPGAWQGIH